MYLSLLNHIPHLNKYWFLINSPRNSDGLVPYSMSQCPADILYRTQDLQLAYGYGGLQNQWYK